MVIVQADVAGQKIINVLVRVLLHNNANQIPPWFENIQAVVEVTKEANENKDKIKSFCDAGLPLPMA